MKNIHLNYDEMITILSALTYTYLYGHLTAENAKNLRLITYKIMELELSSSEHFNLEKSI